MEHNLIKQVKGLRLLVLILVALNAFLILSAFGDKLKTEKFSEIDVERINILGTNGKPVMVISNNQKIPGVSMNGKTYPKEFSDGRERYSGIIFFNEQGDEVGGLLYNGFPLKDSGYFAIEHLSFDQWKQNQVVAIQYIDNGKIRRSGLRVWDRPSTVTMDEIFDRFVTRNKLPKNSSSYDSITKIIQASNARGDNGVERMFVGSLNEEAQIQLKDKKGNTRAKLYIDKDGDARLEFLNENGTVKKTFPD